MRELSNNIKRKFRPLKLILANAYPEREETIKTPPLLSEKYTGCSNTAAKRLIGKSRDEVFKMP